eukprot:scaffold166731_cov36-Prasinocladus_malaysianus.AAC.1
MPYSRDIAAEQAGILPYVFIGGWVAGGSFWDGRRLKYDTGRHRRRKPPQLPALLCTRLLAGIGSYGYRYEYSYEVRLATSQAPVPVPVAGTITHSVTRTSTRTCWRTKGTSTYTHTRTSVKSELMCHPIRQSCNFSPKASAASYDHYAYA